MVVGKRLRGDKMLVQSFIEFDQDQILKLILQDSQPGKSYLLSKIHKPNNPGRPIVYNKLILNEKISQYVEFHLTLWSPTFPKWEHRFKNT